MLFGDDLAISGERGGRLAEVQRLPSALRVSGEALEIHGELRRQVSPRDRIARIPEHDGARFEPQERRHRFAGARGQAERGNRADRDLAVHRDQARHGAKAQGSNAREHDDHERRRQENLRGQPHLILPLVIVEPIEAPPRAVACVSLDR